MEERLQKVLADAGVASRRKCEQLILAGRVSVNGNVVTTLGTKADPMRDVLTVDSVVISVRHDTVGLILHKPTSYVTTVADPQGRRTVMELLQEVRERVYPVGRLDYDSTGLLLFCNDGELTNRLLHPSFKLEKVYRVTLLGMPNSDELDQLRRGVKLTDGMTLPTKVKVLRNHPLESVLEITLREGRKRQIRRMCEFLGYPVRRLKRVEFGPLKLGDLPPGHWRYLTQEEWAALYRDVGLDLPQE
ncbi:rRNA pseudouridine synthase [Alicyclobacillaceae bacterium I2511]|jgi:23S rRNA pseudouridine2605 synthase|nr:rRNA pseudouridine synthase [Alicyclobacillaceae bacterium I2511]